MGEKLLQAVLGGIESGALVQGVLTVMVVGAWLAMVLQGKPTPPMLDNLTMAVVAFWMGGKVQTGIVQQVRTLRAA